MPLPAAPSLHARAPVVGDPDCAQPCCRPKPAALLRGSTGRLEEQRNERNERKDERLGSLPRSSRTTARLPPETATPLPFLSTISLISLSIPYALRFAVLTDSHLPRSHERAHGSLARLSGQPPGFSNRRRAGDSAERAPVPRHPVALRCVVLCCEIARTTPPDRSATRLMPLVRDAPTSPATPHRRACLRRASSRAARREYSCRDRSPRRPWHRRPGRL